MRVKHNIFLYEHDEVVIKEGMDDGEIILELQSAYTDVVKICLCPAHLSQLKRELKNYEGRKKDE